MDAFETLSEKVLKGARTYDKLSRIYDTPYMKLLNRLDRQLAPFTMAHHANLDLSRFSQVGYTTGLTDYVKVTKGMTMWLDKINSGLATHSIVKQSAQNKQWFDAINSISAIAQSISVPQKVAINFEGLSAVNSAVKMASHVRLHNESYGLFNAAIDELLKNRILYNELEDKPLSADQISQRKDEFLEELEEKTKEAQAAIESSKPKKDKQEFELIPIFDFQSLFVQILALLAIKHFGLSREKAVIFGSIFLMLIKTIGKLNETELCTLQDAWATSVKTEIRYVIPTEISLCQTGVFSQSRTTSKLLNTVEVGQYVEVLEKRRKWMRIAYVDEKTLNPVSGWVNMQDFTLSDEYLCIRSGESIPE